VTGFPQPEPEQAELPTADFSSTPQLNIRLIEADQSLLGAVALEDFGPGLTRTEFNDVILWLFESIAGFETLPSKLTQWYLRLLWSK
jgi:hypothetical protein